MKKIQRVSLFFRIFLQVIFLGWVAVYIYFWIFTPSSLSFDLIPPLTGFLTISFVPKGIAALVTTQSIAGPTKLLGFCAGLMPLIINLAVLYFLIRLFSLYEQGKIFTFNNIKYIKRTAYALLIGQFVNLFYQAAISAILTWHNPIGHRYVVVGLSGMNIGILLLAVLIILIAWIMTEAYKLQEEQQYIV